MDLHIRRLEIHEMLEYLKNLVAEKIDHERPEYSWEVGHI